MASSKKYLDDIRALLAKRHDNGADFWATQDGRWGVGSPFSTFDCALILSELGLQRSDPLMKGTANQILSAWREDGRFRASPKGAMHPCHTADAARALCHLGCARDKRLKATFQHLLAAQQDDGGWRCNAVRLGKSPETDASNPGTTLAALDGFRFTPFLNTDDQLNRAVEFLLEHWRSRKPLGPCRFGIGTLFKQIEYPFLRYNLFFYVYVLSFYEVARNDPRFTDALNALTSKEKDGKVVVENPNRKLADFLFCKKGEPSELASKRMREIRKNLAAA